MTTSYERQIVERVTRTATLGLLDVAIRSVAQLEAETPDHWLPQVLMSLTEARRALEYSRSFSAEPRDAH